MLPAPELDCGAEPFPVDADRFVLWMIRHAVFCAGHPNLVERSLMRRLGRERGREAYLALRLLLYSVCLFGRRRLRLAPPTAVETTPDERALLQLVAAAQHRAGYLLESSLTWLSAPNAPITPRMPVLRLAELLTEGAIVVPQPPGSGGRSARAGRQRVL